MYHITSSCDKTNWFACSRTERQFSRLWSEIVLSSSAFLSRRNFTARSLTTTYVEMTSVSQWKLYRASPRTAKYLWDIRQACYDLADPQKRILSCGNNLTHIDCYLFCGSDSAREPGSFVLWKFVMF